jgi:hypothetical protein
MRSFAASISLGLLFASLGCATVHGGSGGAAAGREGESTGYCLLLGNSTLPYEVDPLTPSQAEGRAHFVTRYAGGRMRSAIHYASGGRILERVEIDYPPAGGLKLQWFDDYDQPSTTTVVDARGVETQRRRSGAVGKRGCRAWQNREDAEHRVVGELCLDEAGRPTPDEEGCVALAIVRAPRGHIAQSSCLDFDGRLIDDVNGVARTEIETDALGTPVRRTYRTASLALVPSGCSSKQEQLDEHGQSIATTCYTRAGTIEWQRRRSFDARGCLVTDASFDGEGRARAHEGVAATRYTPDAHCESLRTERFDAAAQPAARKPVRSMQYDARGRRMLLLCTDATGAAISCRDDTPPESAASELRYVFDDRGRETELSCFDATTGTPRNCTPYETATRLLTAYDDEGHVTELAGSDAAGHPVEELGAWKQIYRHDAGGRLLSVRWLDRFGRPTLSALGCAELAHDFDANHRLERVRCLGKTAQAIAARGLCDWGRCWPSGTATVEVVRVDPAHPVNRYLGLDGSVLKTVQCEREACYR